MVLGQRAEGLSASEWPPSGGNVMEKSKHALPGGPRQDQWALIARLQRASPALLGALQHEDPASSRTRGNGWLSCSAVSSLCHSSEEQVTPLTSEHRHITSSHHVKYFHGGEQDLRLEVALLLAGGIVWRSLESHPELRQ